MKTAYFKDCVRKLKSNIFQYISIILILALGVAFFVGMNVIAPNMNYTALNYLKTNDIYDLELISTIGFEKRDVQIVKVFPDVLSAEGSYIKDVLIQSGETIISTRINSIFEENMNKLDLTDGRFPENMSECVIDTRMHTMYGYNIGDTIKVKSGTDEKIDDVLNVTEFQVVGIGRNPIYLSQYYGTTELGTGELKALLMVKKDVFKSNIYTSIYLKTNIGENYNYFDDEEEYKIKTEEIGTAVLDKLTPNLQERCNSLYIDLNKEIINAENKLIESRNNFANTKNQIESAEKNIKEQEEIWNEVKLQYQVNNILNPNNIQSISIDTINNMINNIQKSKSEIEKQRNDFESKKETYQNEIIANEEKLDTAKYNLENFSVDLYQNVLTKNESFVSLKNDLVKIGMMGKVFPLMFFIVASLVTITTVSRTIEEERENIGILKAIGYGNFTIAMKFVIYAILTTCIGTTIGIVLGNTLVLQILYSSYGSLYALPDLVKKTNITYLILVIVISAVCIIGVTIFIVVRSLREKASELMRPKSIKEGKQIYLEKVNFLWKHFNFFYKSSFRNIFRYKRRLIMAIVGIAGCTALIYTGFALKSSIDSIAIRQFSEIKTYDMEINLKNELPKSKVQNTLKYIQELDDINEVTPVRQQSTTIYFNDKSKDLYYVVIDKNEIKKYIDIRERINKEKINLTNKGIIITEKIAKSLGIKVGDKVYIGDDTKSNEVKVIGITENYLYNFIYMTPELYEKVYDEELKYNQFFSNTNELDDEDYDDLISKLKENENISGVILTSMIDKEYQKSLTSLSSIVILCIGCASLLAFIVLVNLNIINISERKRELATLKVLGFYDKEVSSYIFRENIILTILGIILGMILGHFALGIIIQSAEVDTIMLPNEISIKSFEYASLLTLVFTLITNYTMNPRIKKINMIDSLKSVE